MENKAKEISPLPSGQAVRREIQRMQCACSRLRALHMQPAPFAHHFAAVYALIAQTASRNLPLDVCTKQGSGCEKRQMGTRGPFLTKEMERLPESSTYHHPSDQPASHRKGRVANDHSGLLSLEPSRRIGRKPGRQDRNSYCRVRKRESFLGAKT